MNRATFEENELVTTEELAKFLKVSPGTVRDWRKKGTGPRALKIGGAVRYPAADVLEWIDGQQVGAQP